MMSHRILPAALLLCTLAACGDLPTQQATQAQPAGPAYDGGFGVGSGNSATQSSGFGMGSGNEIEGNGELTTGDSGIGLGSGNLMIEDSGLGYGSGHTQDTGTATEDGAERGGFGVGSGN